MNKMNKKICVYLSVLVLLSTAFVNSVIAVAEIGNDIETETILPNEATGAETTKESQITQETTQSINEAVEHIEESNNQYKETEGTTTSQFPVELNDIIQPRAPNEISGQEVAPLVTDANLNNRGVQLFSNVHITDIDNNLFNQDNPPFYNDDIRIHFDWSLSDHEEIQAGDHYTYQLPDYFAVHNEVTGELQHATGGSALGQFYLNSNGELKIVFNENAENLSGRTGIIRLETELKVQTISEEIVIETGIYDRNGNEILITLPIYQVDITKSGKVNTNGAIVWDIIFNTESKGLKNVVVTDELPSGLDYSYSYGYLFDGEIWVRDNTLYTYNSTHKTFTFNREINQPVKIEIYSVVNDPTIDSYRNVAKITGANFHEKSVEAEVSYHESAEYKRFLGYDEETNRATWEVSLDLSEDGATLTDRTYSGNKPEDALHYLVEDSIVVQNKKDHSSVTDWHFNHASEIRKDKQLVQFQLVFANAGQYILRYETQLFHPILTSTRLSNYITIKDDTTTSHNGSGTVVPTNKIGVAKSASTKNYQEQTVQWQIEANQHHLEVTNLVITDHYREISGANSSALELLENTLVITAMSPSGASKTLAPTDFELEKLQEIAGENIGEYESGFQIRLTGDYAKTTDKITVRFQTTFDISKQIALGSSKTRLSNSVLIDYKIGDESYKEAAQANSWLDSTWASNALKAGFFIPKGGEIQAYLQAAFNKSFSNIFSEEIASSDQVYWMGLFNTFKSPLKQGTVIVDQLEEGQTFKEIVVYTVEVSGSGNQVKSLNDKLDSSDYQWKYDSNTKVLTVELLKDTSETIAVFIAVEAAEDTYKYHNKITLTDDTLNLIAEAQVEKSAKGSWLSKNGVQNTENNRLLSWEVLINQDSRTINHAVVEDTINYNQQNFLYDEDGNVIVEVYKAIRNENQWQKGEKVSFNTENNPKVTTNGIDGTLTLSVAFEEEITSPYLIVYQTKLDPGIRNNEIVSNDVTLSGGITEIHQVTREIIVKSTNGSGTSTGTNGSLTIKKYDAEEDEESGIEKEAIFQLSRQNAEGNYEIVFPEIIVRNNKIVQGENEVDRLEGLRYGNYKIQEVQAPEGYERDEKEYTFSISSEQIDYTFSLANKKERSPVDLILEATKVLEGRKLLEGEFTFELVDEAGEVIQTQTNTSEGLIHFDTISYDTVGEHYYTLREKAGGDTTIEYDSTVYPVTVTVTDEDGQLEATTSVEGNGVFTNVYTPKAGSVVISAEKILTGRKLEAGEFTFELVDESGKVIQSQTNGQDGSIYFEAINYDKAGEYHYTLREKVGTDETIEYDSTTYPVTVTVTEVHGQLEAKVNDNKQAVFVNKSKLVSDEDTEDSGKEKPQVEEDPTEKEPKDEPTSDGKNKLPQTGELNQISWMVAGGLFVSIVGIISYYRRQRSKTK
jgi:pilin isopeptide linkage protein/LPXTG-motif cell wall-anchored protein